jgi:hypothetical protein
LLHPGPDEQRNLLLIFDDSGIDVSDDARRLLDQVRDETEAAHATRALNRTGSLKHVVGEWLGGKSGNTTLPIAAVPIYKFGPVPAVVVGESNGIRVALYPKFRTTIDVESDQNGRSLVLRLKSYRDATIKRLFKHYLENVCARLKDIEFCRSHSAAFDECRLALREVEESILGKLRDVYRGLHSSDPQIADICREMAAGSGAWLQIGAFASTYIIEVILKYFELFGVRIQHREVWSKRYFYPPSTAIERNDVLLALQQGQEDLASDNADDLQVLSQNFPANWLGELFSFSRAIAETSVRVAEQTKRDYKERRNDSFRPRLFISARTRSSEVTATTIAVLPEVVRERRLPIAITTGVRTSGDVQDNARFGIMLSAAVMPFIHKMTDESNDFAWIIRETEHGLLCQKRIIPAIETGADIPEFLVSAETADIRWIFQDYRTDNDHQRRSRVTKAFARSWIPFTGGVPGRTVDENLLAALREEAVILGRRQCETYIEMAMSHLDEEVKRWVAFVINQTLHAVKTKDELFRPSQVRQPGLKTRAVMPWKSFRISSTAFDGVQERYNRQSVAFQSKGGWFRLVNRTSHGAYDNGLEKLMQCIGLTRIISRIDILKMKNDFLRFVCKISTGSSEISVN